jgi:hypothetical protein
MIKNEAAKIENSMKLRNITKEEFVSAITKDKADGFAKTFVAKADAFDLWDRCIGAFIEDQLAGAIIVSVSKRNPILFRLGKSKMGPVSGVYAQG